MFTLQTNIMDCTVSTYMHRTSPHMLSVSNEETRRSGGVKYTALLLSLSLSPTSTHKHTYKQAHIITQALPLNHGMLKSRPMGGRMKMFMMPRMESSRAARLCAMPEVVA